MTQYQLRTYRLRDGAVDEFLALWRDHVVPARRAAGFEVVGAWLDADRQEFTWIARHPAPDGLEAAERAYMQSAEKAAIPRRPGELFLASSVRAVEPVDPAAAGARPPD